MAAWDLGGNTLTVMPMGKVEAFERIATLSGFFPPANFYRILIPELFPELTKAIYLDSDMVVVGDLGELWDIDLGDKLMGVVYMEPDFSTCDEYNEVAEAVEQGNMTREQLRLWIIEHYRTIEPIKKHVYKTPE